MSGDTFVIVTARNESDRIAATLRALAEAFPSASLWVVDDGSSDDTCARACAAGARVVRSERPLGKGAAATLGARRALHSLQPDGRAVALLCDGDLADSAARLRPLLDALAAGDGDIAVASFAARVGGGFGLVLGYARRAIRRRCGLRLQAPLSGQRAMRARTLEALLPFAGGFGMEAAMAIDAARAGQRIVEIELDLSHRATGRTPAGFVHRARQLWDVVRAVHRRPRASPP